MSPPPISPFILRFFRLIARRSFRQRFEAVRIAGTHHLAAIGQGPLIVYANHSSWWDVMVQVVLAEQFFPARKHYAPIDERSLLRYPILRKIGVFPIDITSPRGAAQFLRISLSLLGPDTVLWITPQGRFADPRERPLVFKNGLAALAARAPGPVTLLPLAIEYPFWDLRRPECLLQFGQPILSTPESPATTATLESTLETLMDDLRLKALARSPAPFTSLCQTAVTTIQTAVTTIQTAQPTPIPTTLKDRG